MKPESDRRLSDLVSVGLLTRVFPPEVVDAVIAESGRTEQRHRALPARTMAYFAIGMALHADGSYEDVLGLMTDGLAWSLPEAAPVKLPSKSAIFQARERLRAEPLKALFERVAQPLATSETPGAWLGGRRLVALDGTCLDVTDTDVNDEHFGRPGVTKGERSAFPQARVVGVVECGTHAIIDAVVGAYTTGENTLARQLVARFGPGTLVLADRGFCGFPLWSLAVRTGADLLWRASSVMKPRLIETLDDGSWLAEFRPSGNARRHAEPLTIRVIDYEVDDGRGDPSGPYRLFTTLLDPAEAPAGELAFAYAQRWEIELCFAELKTHQRGSTAGLRSKSPALVEQEIWGHLCCHYAIRSLMTQAAGHAGHDPDRVSFVAALRITRATIAHTGDFPP